MSSLSPVWLLDVDGVLNAPRAGWSNPPNQASVYAQGVVWKFRWEEKATSFIRSVILSGRAEVRWCTTWIPWARDIERVFKLPPLQCAFTIEGTNTPIVKAKSAAALRVLEEENRPLIWTDDDAIPDFGPIRERIDAASQPSLLISPNSRKGLRPEDSEAINGFIESF